MRLPQPHRPSGIPQNLPVSPIHEVPMPHPTRRRFLRPKQDPTRPTRQPVMQQPPPRRIPQSPRIQLPMQSRSRPLPHPPRPRHPRRSLLRKHSRVVYMKPVPILIPITHPPIKPRKGALTPGRRHFVGSWTSWRSSRWSAQNSVPTNGRTTRSNHSTKCRPRGVRARPAGRLIFR
jgi:hypothetical protein